MFSFTVEACCELDGTNRLGSLPFYFEKDSFLPHVIAGQSMYSNLPWSLAMQYAEHIRTSNAKSPMNTKVVIKLPNWPQFNEATIGLRLLRQVPIDNIVFTKPSPLGKRHNIS